MHSSKTTHVLPVNTYSGYIFIGNIGGVGGTAALMTKDGSTITFYNIKDKLNCSQYFITSLSGSNLTVTLKNGGATIAIGV